MNINIVTDYPLWFIIFCFILAWAYSFLLYRRDRKLVELQRWHRNLLRAARFIVVFILSFLLLSPFIKSVSKTVQQPVIIFAQDNSQSILYNKDSVFYKTDYQEEIDKLLSKLSDKYEVIRYTIGNEIKKQDSITFQENTSNLSEIFTYIQNNLSNRNVGAMIFASDGIYNQGLSPVYSAQDITFPVYPIALGDTSVQKDIVLADVKSNKIAFLGNKFPVKTFIEVRKFKGHKAQFSIRKGNEELFKKDITVTSDNYTEVVDIELDANSHGLQHYKLKISQAENEVNYYNNYKDLIIDVIDSKQKVLILVNSPHPDAGAIKSALEKNKNVEVDLLTTDKLSNKLSDYNMVILHQLPSVSNPVSQVLADIKKLEVPVLFIVGNQTDLNGINNLQTGVNITQKSKSNNESQAIINERFTLFEIDDELKFFVKDAPPLVTPFGDYKISNSFEELFYQRIRNVETNTPLAVFTSNGLLNNSKTGFILGEGIWKWRLNNYLHYQNDDIFNNLVNKICQFMALKLNKDNFRINSKSIFNENEFITFEAELYNDSYELVNNGTVSIDITDLQGKIYKFSFVPNASGTGTYIFNGGNFPTGDYSYEAKAVLGEKTFIKRGKFSVIQINTEAENTVANHQVLYQLGNRSIGKLYKINQIDQIAEDINQDANIVPVSFTEKKLKEIVHFKWIFFLIIVLLAGEWFFRKYMGSY